MVNFELRPTLWLEYYFFVVMSTSLGLFKVISERFNDLFILSFLLSEECRTSCAV